MDVLDGLMTLYNLSTVCKSTNNKFAQLMEQIFKIKICCSHHRLMDMLVFWQQTIHNSRYIINIISNQTTKLCLLLG